MEVADFLGPMCGNGKPCSPDAVQYEFLLVSGVK